MFDEERIERELRQAMEKAYREYAEACRQSDEPLEISAESELSSPDGSQAMLNATKRRTLAFEAYRKALQAFSDYVVDHKVPPDLLEHE